jgi:hypothetical protein
MGSGTGTGTVGGSPVDFEIVSAVADRLRWEGVLDLRAGGAPFTCRSGFIVDEFIGDRPYLVIGLSVEYSGPGVYALPDPRTYESTLQLALGNGDTTIGNVVDGTLTIDDDSGGWISGSFEATITGNLDGVVSGDFRAPICDHLYPL